MSTRFLGVLQAAVIGMSLIVPPLAQAAAAEVPGTLPDKRADGTASRADWIRGLHRALARHQAVSLSGGWPTLEGGPLLRPGERGDRVPVLRERLQASGDLAAGAEPEDRLLYHSDLVAAVERFQRRHGLLVDGVVGPQTREALNVPVQRRIEQILVNIERARQLPADLGKSHVLVNIPELQMSLRHAEGTVADQRAIVGRTSRRTPVFSTEITHVVANPDWTVPTSIVRRDLLPRLRSDPGYLKRKGFRVYAGWERDAPELDVDTIDWSTVDGSVPYVFRQDPGPQNALGQVKFEMPNPYSVFLHGTPDLHLFDRQQRFFSSGCVRLEDPYGLANSLLTESGGAASSLAHALDSGQTRFLRLPEPVPVHLVYFTAWVDHHGVVQFREDVYDRDTASWASLSKDRSG